MKVKLKDLGVISTGNTPSKNIPEFYNSKDIGFVKPDVISDSQIDSVEITQEYLSEVARRKARIVKKDAIFVTCIGTIGKVGIVKAKELAFNQQINAITPNSDIVSKYLAYCIFANRKKLQAVANAPVVPIINKTQFGDFEVDITSNITRQELIVKILDLINNIITLRKQQLQQLDDLVKARFVEMFGDRLESNTVKLSTLTAVITKGTTPTTLGFDFTDSGINFVKIECITEDSKFIFSKMLHISEECNQKLKRSILQEGDVLFSIAGAIGRTAIVTKEILPANTNQAVAIIRLRKDCGLNVKFLNQMLHSSLVENQVNIKKAGVAQINLSLTDIGDFNVIVPPMEEQEQFATFVEQVDKSKVAVQKALDEAQTLFDSLMQEYFE